LHAKQQPDSIIRLHPFASLYAFNVPYSLIKRVKWRRVFLSRR